MTPTTRNALIASAFAVALAGSLWWWSAATTPSAPAASPAGSGASTTPSSEVESAAPIESQEEMASAADLVPAGTPLPALRARLEGAARGGDARAACRLAIETGRCHMANFVDPFIMDRLGSRPFDELEALVAAERGQLSTLTPRDPRLEQAFAEHRAAIEERREACGPITSAQADEALRFLRQSALAGVADAQQVYTGGEGWALSTPGALAHPIYEMWEREAPALLLRMLDEGHPEAPGMLAMGYGGIGWMSGLFDTDRERAAAYGLLNARLLASPSQMLEGFWLRALDPAAQARARAEADRLYRAHYAGRHAVAGPALSSLSAPMVRNLMQPHASAPCSPPATAP